MKISTRIAAALIALVAAGHAHADVLKGRVVDSKGVGLVGVKVTVPDRNVSVTSAANGVFALIVRAGTYDVEFEPSTAYAPRLVEAVAVSGTKDMGNVTLAAGFALSGRVVDAANASVPNANINVYDSATRRKLFTPGDNTDLLGQFRVIVPAGAYRVRVKSPTTRTLVAYEVDPIVVKANTSIGTVTLRNGFVVTGLVVDATTKAPIVDADLDADDANTGERIPTPDDNTDATGRFRLVLPAGLYHLGFQPPASSSNVAARRFNVAVTATTNTGTQELARGLVVTGSVASASGPVEGADIDLRTIPGEQSIYLANDHSDRTGAFRVVVPAGRYHLTIEPPVRALLAGARSASLNITQNTTVPKITLAQGYAVSGTVRDAGGRFETDCDLDALDPKTGNELIVVGDKTDASGNYSLILPKGTWDVVFRPRKDSLSRDATIKSVTVPRATRLDKRLELAPVTAYVSTFGIPYVPNRGTVPTHLAFVNPTTTIVNTRLSISVIDPDGVATPLFTPFNLTIYPTQFGLFFALPFPVPPAKTAHLGKIFHLELRFEDAASKVTIDADRFPFVIR